MKKLVFLFLFLVPFTSALTDISQCQNLTQANEVYRLTADITTTQKVCFNITAENITLDCQGHKISFGGGTSMRAILVYQANRSTIKNCIINNTDPIPLCYPFSASDNYGILLYKSADHTIFNNTISVSRHKDFPIYLYYSSGNNITLNTLKSYGLFSHTLILHNYSDNNWIENNTFLPYGPFASGVWISRSTNNTFKNNLFYFKSQAFWILEGKGGFDSKFFNQSIDETNKKNGKPIKFYKFIKDSVLTNLDTYSEIILANSTNITVKNTSFNGTNLVLTWTNQIHILNNTFLNAPGDVIFARRTNNSEIKDNTIQAIHGMGIVFYSKSKNNTIIGNNINTSYQCGYGVHISYSSDFLISNNTIRTTGFVGIGLHLENSTGIKGSGNRIHTENQEKAYGIYLAEYGTGVEATINDSVINASNCEDVYFASASRTVNLINCTFNHSETKWYSTNLHSVLNVLWYLETWVYDPTSDSYVAGATVRVYDKDKTLQATKTTNQDGWTKFALKEYTQNATTTQSFIPYYVNSTYLAYSSSTKTVYLDENKNVTLELSVPCLLYTSPSPRDLSTSRMPSSA